MKDIDEFLQECNFWLEKIATAKQREEQALMEKAAWFARVGKLFGGANKLKTPTVPKSIPQNANGFGSARAKQLKAWTDGKHLTQRNPLTIKKTPTSPNPPAPKPAAPESPAGASPATPTTKPSAKTPEAPKPPAKTPEAPKTPAETPANVELPPVPKEFPKTPAAAGAEAASKTPGWFGRHPLLTAGLGATAGGVGVHLFSSQPTAPQQVAVQPTSEQVAAYYNAYAPQRAY